MTSENQEMNYGMPEANVAENQEAKNYPSVTSKNNAVDHVMYDDFFRNFIQFMQNQARGTPTYNTGGNAGNLRMVTAKQFKKLRPPEFFGKPDPFKTKSWIKQMMKIFDVLRCSVRSLILQSLEIMEFKKMASAV